MSIQYGGKKVYGKQQSERGRGKADENPLSGGSQGNIL